MRIPERAISIGRRLPPTVGKAAFRGVHTAQGLAGAVLYLRDWRAYRALPNAEPLRLRDAQPEVFDRIAVSPFDRHYFYQDVWAAHRIAERGPSGHVDVGSRVDLVGFLTAICPVTFVDLRPLEARVDGLTSVAGSVLDMPLGDGTIESLSCLHVAEHIGLGRYGDPLDPAGTRNAAAELARVLAPGGELLFSLPVGERRVCYNAHRIHAPSDIPAMVPSLGLVEFAGVDDAGTFARHRRLSELEGSRYACGMYRFRRPHTG